MTESLIHLEARVERNDFVLDVNLRVTTRVLGIVGPSGSGKSTLIGVAAGLIHPQRCELTVEGKVLASSRHRSVLRAENRGIGLVSQEGLLFPHWTVQKNLSCGRHGPPPDIGVVQAMAERLGISEMLPRPVMSLSGGQRQRVALGRALLSGARWLLLDEPLGALDYARRRSLLPLLRAVVDSTEIPLWIVSHDIAEVMALCDEVVTLEHGRVVAQRKVESLARALITHTDDDRFENLLRGTIESSTGDLTTVQVGPQTRFHSHRVLAEPGQSVFVSLYADDIMIAVERPVGISARNVLPARITELPSAAVALTNLRLHDGLTLKTQLAESTIRDLGLYEGANVFALFKANACRVWSG